MNPSRRGFTLVECSIAAAAAAILVAIALPSYHGRELKVARLDAVEALTRLQLTQEQYRAAHGLYAHDLQGLRGVAATSGQGRYTLTLQRTGADAYRAVAHAHGVQAKDRDCPEVTLDVAMGFPTYGPKPACWNR